MNFVPLFFAVVFGLIMGSFFNAVVWRFGRGKPITEQHSVCIHCGRELRALDLIPLLSYLALRGRCRSCTKPIPWHYPVVEAATALLLVPPLILFGPSVRFVLTAALVLLLELLFLLDLRYSVLPDALTLPGLALGLAVGVVAGIDFRHALAGGILGAGFFALQYFFSRGKWIGAGDIRLGGIMGLALGWQLVLFALGLAYCVGAAVGVLLIATKQKGWKSHIPFGTFLAGSTYLFLCWGESFMAVFRSSLLL